MCAAGKPSLIMYGIADNILPIDATGRRFHEAFAMRCCVSSTPEPSTTSTL